MTHLLKLSDLLAGIVRTVGRLASYLAVLLMIVIVTDVSTRSLRQSTDPNSAVGQFLKGFGDLLSSSKLQEMEWHIHGALLLLCLGYGYVCNTHVRVTVFSDLFPRRRRLWVEVIGISVGFSLICYVMIRFGYDFAERAYLRNEGSSALTGLPHRWIIKSLIPVAFILVAMAGTATLIRLIAALRGDIDDEQIFLDR